MPHCSFFKICLLASLLGCLSFKPAMLAQTSPELTFNEHFIKGLNASFPLDAPQSVFSWVYSHLPDSVFVYPTENYYYFRLYAAGRWVWGNLRFGILDRDEGKIHFAYYDYVDKPSDPEEGDLKTLTLGASDGLALAQIRPLCYQASWKGKKVLFQLNNLSQTPPAKFSLSTDEVFINRTCDESGFPFFLLYKGDQNHFMFVLNEEGPLPGKLIPLGEGLVWDKLSGFVFYVDSLRQYRKILVGVWAQNIRRNNYWDGPFDQLADNAPHPQFKMYLEKAYPYAKGGLDDYGFFKIIEHSRMAITPYFEYESLQELLENVRTCRTTAPSKEFFACLCYDVKTSYEAIRE